MAAEISHGNISSNRTSRPLPPIAAQPCHIQSLWATLEAGSARDGLPVALPVVVTPGDELLQGAQIVVGAANAVDEVRDPLLYVFIDVLDVLGPDGYGALYLFRVSSHLLAPVVEDAALAGGPLGVPKAVPDVGVLGHDAKGNLLAPATDEDGDGSRGRRVQLLETLFDHGHRRVEVEQPASFGAELVAVLVVFLLEPSGADAKDQTPVRDVVHRAGHVREQTRVPVRVARYERPELYPLGDLGHRRKESPALEVLAVGVPVERMEVVPGVERVGPHVLDPEPRVAHLRVAGLLRMKLRPDPYRHPSPPVLANREIMPRYRREEDV